MNRRTLLEGAAALAGVGLIRTCRGAATLPKPKFTLNLNTGQVGVRATPLEAVTLARKYGYRSITPMPWAMRKASPDELARLTSEMRAAGLLWGAAPVGPFFHADEAKFKERRKRIAQTAEVLQRAKATRCFTWVSPGSGTATYRANFELHVRRTREVGKLLADHGLRIGLEYIGTKTLGLKGKAQTTF